MMTIKELSVSFGHKPVVKSFSECFGKGEIVTIIGPNGSGKSTILKAAAKLIRKEQGTVYLSGRDMAELSPKQVARQLAVLMQTNDCPASFTVRQLVAYGRMPHQRWYEASDPNQTEVVNWAIRAAGIGELEHRTVMSLSGGERQRAWIAMALAQEPSILFLDEPTTYLDICHQLEIMNLVQRLNHEHGLSVVMVLHDLNQAAQFSHKIIAIKDGGIYACGAPREVLTPRLFQEIYGVEAELSYNEATKRLTIVPVALVSKAPGVKDEVSCLIKEGEALRAV